ncbi:branched-chain amino acid ABC transporter permease [Microbacterium sp. SMR1]|uniref:branched-chain amino acid ABC transporter permease n=1 Tax=Microbacterium sp. SMR1 TaxID=1497340 RepID=UPI001C66F12F|nr:branched-chain amino acid ABC transporter permease [Microbacterium sp. SMR1]
MTIQASPPTAPAAEKSVRTRGYNGPSPRALLVTLGVLTLAAVAAGVISGSPTVLAQALVTGLLTGGIYSLIAMGLTLVYGVLHIINFANGAMVALAMYLTYVLVNLTGMHPYATLLITVPTMFLLGAVTQAGLLNPIMRAPIHTQLLITIGLALAIENILLLVFGPNPLSVQLPGNTGVPILGATVDLSRIYAFAGALVLVAALWLILQRTPVGTAVRSVAANPEGARLVGIDIKGIYILTFALGAAAAGAAGTLVAPFTTIEPTAGSVFNLTAFVVVVLGGMGNVPGALVGGLIVGLTEQLGGLILPGQSPLLAVFVVFLIVLFAKPRGIFGRTA